MNYEDLFFWLYGWSPGSLLHGLLIADGPGLSVAFFRSAGAFDQNRLESNATTTRGEGGGCLLISHYSHFIGSLKIQTSITIVGPNLKKNDCWYIVENAFEKQF